MARSSVAPRAGAWIETRVISSGSVISLHVAPRAGAWIETLSVHLYTSPSLYVAPRAGAWIETITPPPLYLKTCLSHPVRVRGLKLLSMLLVVALIRSHPVRVRGLKLTPEELNDIRHDVAPRAGAWIETLAPIGNRHAVSASHPVRVRGLKPVSWPNFISYKSRTPCGCVD